MVAYKTKYGIMLPLVVVVCVGGCRSFISGLPWRIIQFNSQELNKGLVLKLTHRCWVSLGNQTLNVWKNELSDGYPVCETDKTCFGSGGQLISAISAIFRGNSQHTRNSYRGCIYKDDKIVQTVAPCQVSWPKVACKCVNLGRQFKFQGGGSFFFFFKLQ